MEHDWFKARAGARPQAIAPKCRARRAGRRGLARCGRWLMRPINAWAQDLATPVADPGSAGEIGTRNGPYRTPWSIFRESPLRPSLWALSGANGLLSPEARIPRRTRMSLPTADRELLGEPSRRRHSLPIRSAERAVPDRGLRAAGRSILRQPIASTSTSCRSMAVGTAPVRLE